MLSIIFVISIVLVSIVIVCLLSTLGVASGILILPLVLDVVVLVYIIKSLVKKSK